MWSKLIAAAVLAYATVTGALAQSYPSKPIRMIVPFTPAGATDVLARLVGEELSQRLGQPIIIENRPGAGGNIGARIAARAAPDGYTLIMAPSSIYAIAMTLYGDPGYNVVSDFAPVSTVANALHVLVANPTVPVASLADLIALAKARPDELNIASQGTGTVSHLEAVMLQQMAGIEMIHVPYKGSAPAVFDLMGGRVQVMFDSVASTLPHIRAGKLKAVAVPTLQRIELLPQVPTLDEAGLHGYQAESWLGIMLPAGAPKAVIGRLNRELVAILADARTRQTLIDRGFQPQSSTPEQFAQRIREDVVTWGKVVRAAGVRVD